jgi:hypothetical protein
LEVPPEFFDEDPEMGFARQGIDFDNILQRINALNTTKSDTSILPEPVGSDMDAFTEAWNVLKSNTLPIKPEIMQYETAPKNWSRYKQKMMDDFPQREEDAGPYGPLAMGETDIMDQHGYRGRDRTEE